ncbi:hypothetical protein CLV97_1592 [Planifilum fimeticola]|uniref:Uncharacterized protein n=1 Tax=Planifilum fimeticola TaxID=201975 RepID=A0A2T0L9S5_9BACL|nr:hypothetical protein CLV97_1592 [Planifilum fimeticola]
MVTYWMLEEVLLVDPCMKMRIPLDMLLTNTEGLKRF